MIRPDRAFAFGTPHSEVRHSQTLWVLATVLLTIFFGANVWVTTFYPSDRVFHNLVLGGPYSQLTDVWRPLTAFLFEPNLPGLLVSYAALFLIVRELEGTRGSRWLLGIWVITLAFTVLGYVLGDRLLLGRPNAIVLGTCAPLVVLCLTFAREHRDRDVYPFLFLQMKGRNLGLAVAVLLVAAYDFRTLPYWSSGAHSVVVSALAPLVGVIGGLGIVLLEPTLQRRFALSRALREVRGVQRDAERRERVDRLLAKVASAGIESLSRRELRFLRWSARGLRAGPAAGKDVDRRRMSITGRRAKGTDSLRPHSSIEGEDDNDFEQE